MKHRAYRFFICAHLSALLLTLLATATWAQQPTLTWLPLPPEYQGSYAYDISADGKIVVGVFLAGRPCVDRYPFMWTRERGYTILTTGSFLGANTQAISQDGLTIVGFCSNSCNEQSGAIWTFNGLQTLSDPVGERCYDVSADGSVIVGETAKFGALRAFRWTASSGMQNLGTLGGTESVAWSVSADGAVVVGYALDSSNKRRAFRWTQQDGMRDLGTGVRSGNSTQFYDQSESWAVSPDGNVIVGIAYNSNRNEAVGFRNIYDPQSNQRFNELLSETPMGFTAVYPYHANQDGSIIVGRMRRQEDGRGRAFRWTKAGGIEDLNVTYANLLGPGEYLEYAWDITPDGRYIVGWGWKDGKSQVYVLDTGFCNLPADVNDDGVVNDADLLQVLFNFGTGCNN